MSTLLHVSSRNPFDTSPTHQRSRSKTMATLSESGTSPKSSRGDRSQATSPSTMGPPQNNSPEAESNGHSVGANKEQPEPQPSASHVGNSQSKVVQTAFIHKLYSMLEDQSIRHLISWSNTNDSFVMSPSNEFSKVLAQYFKHTNISSFVRQLNMYGFHKVSDVFHTGSPESALWEFRHGNGNFKKGDLMGLREIKRRASRHTLIHRDSFANPKPSPSQPGTPQEVPPDPEQRMAHLEHMVYDMHSRLARTEDSYALVSSRCQALTDSLVRMHQWIDTLTSSVSTIASQDQQLNSTLTSMQQDMQRQVELIRSLEQQPLEPSGSSRMLYPTNMALDPPLSPRGYGFSDSRRSSIQLQEPPGTFSRPPVPPIPAQFTSPRRFGSVGGPQSSPGFSRPALPPPPQPHPLSNVVSPPPPPNLARRHTSADIREHGWPIPNPNADGSPYASGESSVQWQPSSPSQGLPPADEQIQNQLASYSINGGRRNTAVPVSESAPALSEPSRPAPPTGLAVESPSWPPGAAKIPRPNFELHSAPATRRSSMASNVHWLLNPAETAERPHEDEALNENRKRTRLE